MSKSTFFSQLQKAKSERQTRGDNSRMPRGNITAVVKEMDVDNEKYGWLLTVEVTGGTNGVGETIQVAPTRKAIEWAEKGKLDQKISEGSEIVLQRVSFPERNETVYTAQRVTGFVLNDADNVKKGRKVLRRVPFKFNMFANGYALVAALPETKEEIAGPEELAARIAVDQAEGRQLLVVGRVNDVPFSAEAILGRYDREKGEFIAFDPESVVQDIMGRVADATRSALEQAEKDGQDAVIEMNAYGLKSYHLGQASRDMLEEQMKEKNRFSQLPIEAMFSRDIYVHVRSALAALGDDGKKVTNAAKAWVEANLDAAGRQAYAQKGFEGLDEADLTKFLESLNIRAPRVPASQSRNWQAARDVLEEGKRKRVSTGWVVGDLVTQTIFDKKKKPIMEYPVRAMHYTASSTAAAPFFPDGKFLQERNDTFFNTVRDGFKAFVSGESVKTAAKPDVAEANTDSDAPAQDELDAALTDLFTDEGLDTDAFPDEGDSAQE